MDNPHPILHGLCSKNLFMDQKHAIWKNFTTFYAVLFTLQLKANYSVITKALSMWVRGLQNRMVFHYKYLRQGYIGEWYVDHIHRDG